MSQVRADRALYIDVEMTCWDGEPPEGQVSEIIQIGVVEVKTETLEISREAEYYVKPKRSAISEYCTALTGITAEVCIQKGHPFGEVLRTLIKKFGPFSKPCFAWGSDEATISEAAFAAGMSDWAFGIMDLSLLYEIDFGLRTSPSLEVALESLNESFIGTPHNALVDARNTARLHIALMRRLRGL